MVLGPIGPTAKKLLARWGYVITRPTEIEKTRLRSFWRQWFSRDPVLFGEVYARNRETLRKVTCWISEETLDASLWHYGLSPGWISDVGLDHLNDSALYTVAGEITAADLLAFIARLYPENVSYLEIGVSVGKTLLQMSNQLSHAHIVGVDVEDLNPVLRNNFDTCELLWRGENSSSVQTLSKGMLQKIASCMRLRSYRTKNTFDYLSADVFQENIWVKLAGDRFNLIFSDGVHTPDSLRRELKFLIENGLLDQKRLVILWDDLWDIGMQTAFLRNAEALCALYNRGEEAISLYVLHGSYGPARYMGMFSTF